MQFLLGPLNKLLLFQCIVLLKVAIPTEFEDLTLLTLKNKLRLNFIDFENKLS